MTDMELVTRPMSALDVRAQVNLIQEVMGEVMKDGTHYGKIPGAGDKPTLFKAGAEKLASTFRLAIDPVVEELSYGDEFRVRVIVRLSEMGSGKFLGAGVGEASSSESKYMWRAAVCQEEYDATPENMRREKWNKGYQNSKPYASKQVRMNVADVANTILKMAKKRAMVDGILTVTGASDIFTQDIEELPKEYLEQRATPASVVEPPTPKMKAEGYPANLSQEQSPILDNPDSEPDITPKSRKANPAPPQAPAPQQQAIQGEVTTEPRISPAQGKRFFAIARSAGVSDDEVTARLAKLGYTGHRDEMPKRIYNAAVDAVDPTFKFHTNEPRG